MKNHWLGTILIFLTLISCNKENTNIPKDDKRTVNQEVVNDLKNSAIELFKQTVASNDQNENILISPLSIQYATGMAINGAKGKTFDELLSVFNKHGQMDSINTSLNILMAKFNKNWIFRSILTHQNWIKKSVKNGCGVNSTLTIRQMLTHLG